MNLRTIVTLAAALAILVLPSALAQKVRVGLGYLPDVQFAPFYAAQRAGFYAKRGLEVEFQHGFSTELYPLLATGRLDFVVADAEDVIGLRAQAGGVAFRYVMAMYQGVPNVLFSRTEKGIKTVRDLKGKRIGLPGRFGTSYTSLQAMLRAAGLTERDVRIEEIGFTQLEAVLRDRVDAAMGYANNEPLVLEAQGVKLNVIRAAPYNASAGNGVITTDRALENADLARRFLAASQEGLRLTLENPRAAFEHARAFVPNLAADRLRVLTASLPYYESSYSRRAGLGFSNPNGWTRTLELLKSVGRLGAALQPGAYFTNAYLTPSIQPRRGS